MSIRYVEIENFKTFGQKLRIELGHPAVLIGPNNAGKTSVIQAISLWSRGIKAWFEKKGGARLKENRERLSAGINRLNILDVPVAETRFFWNGTKVRKANTPIELIISVGVEHKGFTKDCKLIFTYRDSEIIYCKPCSETAKDDELLSFAASLHFHLLYPMSGIMSGQFSGSEETPLPDGRIDFFLGQGQTAQVLRNLCYKVVEHDQQDDTKNWIRIHELMYKLFLIKLNPPVFNETRGTLIMNYQQEGVENVLDISLAGRGLQQILLILAYLYWRRNAVLLVDEPDAHLEILRQRQVYEILKHVAAENGCQVIIATHSEVILDDAIDVNLTLLLHGEAVDMAQLQDMKNALRSFGIEHYYKAKVHPYILYIEGSSDVEMLRALSKKLNHPAFDIFDQKLNCYYIKNTEATDSLHNRLERDSGAFYDKKYKSHFYALKRFVPNLRGVALFDSDGVTKKDEISEDFTVLYWKHYELENYFISPSVLHNFVASYFEENTSLFNTQYTTSFQKIIDNYLLEETFENDPVQLQEFHQASTGLKRTLLKNVKMSAFAEKVFKQFAEQHKQPILMNKGEFYKLVPYMSVDDTTEIKEKLDMLVKYLR